jgi:hypothetical protein
MMFKNLNQSNNYLLQLKTNQNLLEKHLPTAYKKFSQIDFYHIDNDKMHKI